jgi:hypothetical protein
MLYTGILVDIVLLHLGDRSTVFVRDEGMMRMRLKA